MRRSVLAVPSLVVSLVSLIGLARDARAQDAKSAGPAKSSSQFSLRRDEAGGPDASIARGRARGGDCANALPAFDAAVKATIDPTLRRDRGICHEQLKHTFPAIEDYRAYLTARPDAPDSDQIRQRLSVLEGQGETASASGEDNPEIGGNTNAKATANVKVGTSSSARASAKSSSSGDSPGSRDMSNSRDFDTRVKEEHLADSADGSPLRYGRGVVLGPVVHLPRFFLGDGANKDLGYGVALGLRYSTGPVLSLISEIGFSGVGTDGTNTSSSGPLLLGGIELRIPVSRFAGDHLLVRGGLGYERPITTGTRAVNDVVLGRFGFGFRHVFGPSLGFELLADGGPAYFIPENGDGRLNFVVGGSAAFVVGF